MEIDQLPGIETRIMAATHADLSRRLDALEHKAETLAMRHDDFSRNTRAQLRQVFDVPRALMAPPSEPAKRPVGFVTPEDPSRKEPAS